MESQISASELERDYDVVNFHKTLLTVNVDVAEQTIDELIEQIEDRKDALEQSIDGRLVSEIQNELSAITQMYHQINALSEIKSQIWKFIVSRDAEKELLKKE